MLDLFASPLGHPAVARPLDSDRSDTANRRLQPEATSGLWDLVTRAGQQPPSLDLDLVVQREVLHRQVANHVEYLAGVRGNERLDVIVTAVSDRLTREAPKFLLRFPPVHVLETVLQQRVLCRLVNLLLVRMELKPANGLGCQILGHSTATHCPLIGRLAAAHGLQALKDLLELVVPGTHASQSCPC